MCLVVTCWESADLLALVCGVQLWVCHFPIGILGKMWYLIVLIPDLCTLTYLCYFLIQILYLYLLFKYMFLVLQKHIFTEVVYWVPM